MSENTILNYERFSKEIWQHIHTFGDEKVLVCHAFRWHLNGEVVSNGYEMFPAESICRDNNLQIVTKISDELVIVRPAEHCDHEERDHGICLHCGKQTDMNAHDYQPSQP